MSLYDEIEQSKNLLKVAAFADQDDPIRQAAFSKLGVDDQALSAYKTSVYLENSDVPQERQLALDIKNKVFDQVAKTIPVADVQGVSNVERLTLKNVFDTAKPELQKKFLEDRGYVVDVEGDNLFVRKPDETVRQKIDPENIKMDLFEIAKDIGDSTVDLIQGAATAAGTTLTRSMGAGAGIGALTELIKQAARTSLGYSETGDERASNIAQQAGIGAIGGGLGYGVAKYALPMLGKGAQSLGQKLIGEPKLKENAGAVKEAAERLGITELLPTQQLEGQKVRLTTEALVKTGVGKTAKVSENVNRVLTDSAQQAITKATRGFAPGEVSEDSAKIIVDELKAPAEEIYNSVQATLKANQVPKESLQNLLKSLPDTPATQKPRQFLAKQMSKISNLSDLKEARTMVWDELPKNTSDMPYAELKAYRAIRDGLTNIRSQVLKQNSAGNVADSISQADAIYAAAMKEADRFDDVIGIVRKSLNPAKTDISPRALARNISPINLPPSEAKKLFGEEGYQRLLDIKTVSNSLPEQVNPSGTASLIESLKNNVFTYFKNIPNEAILAIAKKVTAPALELPQGVVEKSVRQIGPGILGVQSAKNFSPILDKNKGK